MDKLILTARTGQKDITGIAGRVALSDDLDSFGTELDCQLAKNEDDKYWPKLLPVPGDKLSFGDFQGIVVERRDTGKRMVSVKALDYGFYLQKNEVLIQFNKMAADAAVKKLCSQYGIPLGKVCAMPVLIDKLYSGEAMGDTIRDIVKQAEDDDGIKRRIEIRDGKLQIEKWQDLKITLQHKLAENLAQIDPTKAPADWERTTSIEDTRTAIVVYADTEKDKRKIGQAEDAEAVKRFGRIQAVETIAAKDEAQLGNIAKNRLKQLKNMTDTITATMLGDRKARAGRLLTIEGRDYLITSSRHEYQNGIHKMRLEMVVTN